MKGHMRLHHSLMSTAAEFPSEFLHKARFCGDATKIGWIFYRAGILAALRCFDERQGIGVMVTGSSKGINFNGIKFCDGNGQYMCPTWENIFDDVISITDVDKFVERIEECIKQRTIYCDVRPTRAKIFVAHDTRPSGKYLTNAVIDGIKAMAGTLIPTQNLGLCTTPELFWTVAEANKRSVSKEPSVLNFRPYWEIKIAIFSDIKDHWERENRMKTLKFYDEKSLVVDCANGAARENLRNMQSLYEGAIFPGELINIGSAINELCGADYVRTMRVPPAGANDPKRRYVSLNGDGDKLVYFQLLPSSALRGECSCAQSLRVLDGDRIQALFATFLAEILNESRYNGLLTVRCIQTPYANTACTEFLQRTGFEVICVDVGAACLQREAKNYDIAIYFESDGHGTIHLSDGARELFTGQRKDLIEHIDDTYSESEEDMRANAIWKLMSFLTNPYVGDGIANILLVEYILMRYDWNLNQWYKLYKDRPSRLVNLVAKNKIRIKTSDCGRKVDFPQGLQRDIDQVVANFGPTARAVVRSATSEEVIRVYVEASTQSEADELVRLVGETIIEHCGEPADEFRAL